MEYYGDGDFSFQNVEEDASLYADVWYSVNHVCAWEWLKVQDLTQEKTWNSEMMNVLFHNLKEEHKNEQAIRKGMTIMKVIALIGWETYKNCWMENAAPSAPAASVASVAPIATD